VTSERSSSVIKGRIAVPCRNLYASVVVLALAIGLLVMSTSAWDLVFGTHDLLTRKGTELGPGHPANLEQYFAVFIIVPLLLLTIVIFFGPKARGVTAETHQTTLDFLRTMFQSPMT
jgi:hypothetical protein